MRRLLAILLLVLLPAATAAQPVAPRVLVLGDSLSGGAYAAQPGAAYAARVAVTLGATDSTLVRAGGRLEDAEASWATYGGRGWDVVVLEIGINDSLAPTIPDGAVWAARYAALASSISASGARLVCATPFDIGEPGIDLAARAALVRASCAGGAVADVWAATAGRADLRAAPGDATFYAGGVARDRYHPTDAGHALIATLIVAAIPRRAYLPALTR